MKLKTILLCELFEQVPEPQGISGASAPGAEQPDELQGFIDVEDADKIIDQDAKKIKDTLEGAMAPEPGIDEETPTENSDTTTAATNMEEDLISEDAATKAIVDAIVTSSGGKFHFGGIKKSAYRLRLSNAKDDVAAIIKKSLRGYKIKAVAPGQPGAASSKYTTYIVARSGVTPAKVVFSAGKNEGQKFETQLKNSISSRRGPFWNALSGKLREFFGILPADIARVDKSAGGSSRVTRPFTSKLQNVGAILSDMNIKLLKPRNIGGVVTDMLYVSIKNVSGATFANTGYSDAFSLTGARVVAKPSVARPAVDQFLTACGVDKDKVAVGLTDFFRTSKGKAINSKHKIMDTPAFNGQKIKEILAAQVGYGYVYVREEKAGLKILDLTAPQDALDLVGTINSVTVRYPYVLQGKASKQCTITIDTTTGKFVAELRNTQGGIIPQQLNLRMAG